MTYNAADRKHVRLNEKAQLAALVVRGEVITGIMSVTNGRQWMHEVLAALHVFTDPFSDNPYIHAANSGQRSFGIQLFNDIMTFCPKQFTLMIEESHGRSAAADKRTERPNGNGGVEGPSDDATDLAGRQYDDAIDRLNWTDDNGQVVEH